ncbi:hypothetical protein CYL18_00185 [Pradoshia eiseniae]|uniref:Uncharacterized protein n=1 Tax=Pradoshia eiseniae TaxID=2064768 RepID=A0A2S7N2X5_9BACI|nr:hypothetical protein CYL18_00185 [Pradoshia eiseniae]
MIRQVTKGTFTNYKYCAREHVSFYGSMFIFLLALMGFFLARLPILCKQKAGPLPGSESAHQMISK